MTEPTTEESSSGMKVLPKRSTRGKRLADLEGIDKEVDEEFWKLQMFAEEAEDNEFSDVEEVEDVEDSDMDDYSTDEEAEEELAKQKEKKLEKEERASKKRKNVYKDKAAPKKQKEATTTPSKPKAKPSSPLEFIPIETKRSSRKSTQKATEALEEKLKQKETKTPKKSTKKEYYQPTQEELLEEAKITAEINKISLAALVQIEEDIRKKARDTRSKNFDPNAPRVKYHSKDGQHTITFVNTDIPQVINQRLSEEEIARFDIPKEQKQTKCVITGLPAKYLDPLTKKPYATIEAFKQIRSSLTSK